MKKLNNNVVTSKTTKTSNTTGCSYRSNQYKDNIIKLGVQAPASGANPTNGEGAPGAPIIDSEMKAVNPACGADAPASQETQDHVSSMHMSSPCSPAQPGSQPQATPSGAAAVQHAATTTTTPLKQPIEKVAPETTEKFTEPAAYHDAAPCSATESQGMATQTSHVPPTLPELSIETYLACAAEKAADMRRELKNAEEAKNAAERVRDEALAATAAALAAKQQAEAEAQTLRQEVAKTARLKAELEWTKKARDAEKGHYEKNLRGVTKEADARDNAQRKENQKLRAKAEQDKQEIAKKEALLEVGMDRLAKEQAEKKKLEDEVERGRTKEKKIWQSTVKALEEKVQTEETESNNLRAALSSANTELTQTKMELAKRVVESMKASSFLIAVTKDQKITMQQLAEANSKIDTDAKEYASQIASLQSQLFEKDLKISGLLGLAGRRDRMIKAAQKEKESKLQEEVALKREAMEAKDELDRALKRAATLQTSLAKEVREKLALTQSLRKREQALEKESKQAKAAHEELEKDNTQLVAANEELEKEKKQLIAANEELEANAKRDAEHTIRLTEAGELLQTIHERTEFENVVEFNKLGAEIEALRAQPRKRGREESSRRDHTYDHHHKKPRRYRNRCFRRPRDLRDDCGNGNDNGNRIHGQFQK